MLDCYVYALSDDKTHYEFLGRPETGEGLGRWVAENAARGTRLVAGVVVLPYDGGPKICVDGTPYPPSEGDTTPGMELVQQ